MGCLRLKQFLRKTGKSTQQDKPETAPGRSPSQMPEVASSSSVTLQDSQQFANSVTESKSILPVQQEQLILHAPKQAFELTDEAAVPQLKTDREALIKIQTVSLNPVDWKGPAFNFGLPSLPCVLGRDLAGTVIQLPKTKSRLKIGDTVCAVSTDYRDYRKAAFQQYAVASDFNVFRIPKDVKREAASAGGVAFVTAALTLGICLGLDFGRGSRSTKGPDLLSLARSLGRSAIPQDIRAECFDSLDPNDRLREGDWLVIWGASTTVGFFALQLAKAFGVKVICIADAVKYGELLVQHGADVLVHRKNTDEVVEIARNVTGNTARFAIDAVGKDSAGLLQSILAAGQETSGNVPQGSRGHLVGLTGGPKEPAPFVQQHKVPVKLFHESPLIGEAIVTWMEELLLAGQIQLPNVDVSDATGLHAVNPALDRLRQGSLTGQRIVVNIG